MDIPRSTPSRRRRRREGTVAILAVLLLAIMLGFAALVIDVGQIYRVRNELQNVADSTSLAAAQHLDGTANGITAATTAVETYGALHEAEGAAMNFTDDMEVEFGHWYFSDETSVPCGSGPCFDSYGSSPATPSLVNAVRVKGLRTSASNNPVDHFFAPALGRRNSDVSADAIAIGGGPRASECTFPMVVPDCQLRTPATDGTCQWCMVFSAATDDTGGWTSFAESGGCGNPQIENQIISACGATGELVVDGSCTSCDNGTDTSQTIQICNGNQMNRNNQCGTIMAILMRDYGGEGVDNDGDGALDGTAFEVEVPVMESGLSDDDCSDFGFSSGNWAINGYATMTIYGIRCGQASDPLVLDPEFAGEPCQAPPNGDVVLAKLECGGEAEDEAGGPNYGLSAVKVRLVE